MIRSLKNLSLVNNFTSLKNRNCFALAVFLLCYFNSAGQQMANYVNNGGFESKISCLGNNTIEKCRFWSSIDSSSFGAFVLDYCFANVPYDGVRFQYPRSGKGFIGTTFYLPTSYTPRGYVKNRLKAVLQANKIYCVKFYVNLSNVSKYTIDAFSAYFGNASIDTITNCNIPLSYIIPQVKTPNNIFITDTLNWAPVTGTFVANGTEKYLVLGNFKANGNLDSLLINSSITGNTFTDAYIDDVSCIDIDLPAYAGSDAWILPGDSVFIGRQPDVGIDEACMWYKMPNTTTAIDTVAGLWVKPTVTTSYLVRQEICGNVKWDLVTVYISATGLEEYQAVSDNLKIYPQPAANEISLSLNIKQPEEFKEIEIYNNLGSLIKEQEVEFVKKECKIKTDDLPNGIYILSLKNEKGFGINKRLVIAR